MLTRAICHSESIKLLTPCNGVISMRSFFLSQRSRRNALVRVKVFMA